jgi:DNA-directed RNA polymerase specialized sigma24 family protein
LNGEMQEATDLTTERGAERSGRLEDLYERHIGAGMRLAYLLTGNRQQAERETANVLGCSVAAVKSLVARGSAALRNEMGSEES